MRSARNAGAFDGRNRREENFGLAQRFNDAGGDHDTLVRSPGSLSGRLDHEGDIRPGGPAKPIRARDFTGVIRHRLFPTRIIGESGRRYVELLGDEGHQFFGKPGGALKNLSEGHARVAKQRKLKGNAKPIAVFPPQPDLVDVVRL